MRTNGSENHQVTDGGPGAPRLQGGWSTGDFDPEFSPDAQQIVFAYNNPDSQGFGISLVHADGTGRTNLIDGSSTRINGIPDWNEQNLILYSSWSSGLPLWRHYDQSRR